MYADHLTQQGDPRGELIVVQHALASRPGDEALRAREAALLLDRRLSPFAKTNTRDVAWRNGFIRSARFHDTSGFARLLRHPVCRWLQHLWLHESNDLAPMLRDGPDLPQLRQLVVLGGYGSVELALSRKFPRLEHVEISGHALVTDELDLPALRRLHLHGSFCPESTARAICAASCPRLAELEVCFDETQRDGVSSYALEPLFERTDLACLRTVRFHDAEPHIIRLLVGSPFASQLETIDLFGTFIASDMAMALADERAQFPALRTLVISSRYPSPESLARLQVAYGERLRTAHVPRPFATWMAK